MTANKTEKISLNIYLPKELYDWVSATVFQQQQAGDRQSSKNKLICKALEKEKTKWEKKEG